MKGQYHHLVSRQNLIMSWHSEPSKIDQIGKEHIDQETNQVLCQMKVHIHSLKANFGVLRELSQTCSV